MTKIQFAQALKNFDGNDMEEDDAGLPATAHRELRARLQQIGTGPDLLAVFDQMAKPKKKITLGDICCRALNLASARPGAPPLDAKKHVERYELARAIIAAEKAMTPLPLEPEQQVELKAAIPQTFSNSWLVGQACAMLNGNGGDSDGEKSQGPGEGKNKETGKGRGKAR